MRLARFAVTVVAVVTTLTACASSGTAGRTAPPSEPTDSPSPTPTAAPRPEHDDAEVTAAVRRAVSPLAKPSKVTEAGYEPNTWKSTTFAFCDAPSPLAAPSDIDTTVNVDSFFSVSATTKPAVFRSGGQRAEAVGTLRVAASPLAETEQAFQRLTARPCRGGAIHQIFEPVIGVIGYRTTTKKTQIGKSPAFVVTTTADGDRLDKSGYYPLIGHSRVVTRHGDYLISAEVLCARPARPGEAATVTADARRRAVDLATRTVKELTALPAGSPTS